MCFLRKMFLTHKGNKKCLFLIYKLGWIWDELMPYFTHVYFSKTKEFLVLSFHNCSFGKHQNDCIISIIIPNYILLKRRSSLGKMLVWHSCTVTSLCWDMIYWHDILVSLTNGASFFLSCSKFAVIP